MSKRITTDDLISRFSLLAKQGSTLAAMTTGTTLVRELRSYKRCKLRLSKLGTLSYLQGRVDLVQTTCSSHLSGDLNYWINQEREALENSKPRPKAEAQQPRDPRSQGYTPEKAQEWANSLRAMADYIEVAIKSDDFDDWVNVGMMESLVRTNEQEAFS